MEIKKWFEGMLDFYKDIKMVDKEVVLVHSLTCLYLDTTENRINIQTLESMMQEEDLALNGHVGELLHIGKNFLISLVKKYPIT
jgi:hypothetical protein